MSRTKADIADGVIKNWMTKIEELEQRLIEKNRDAGLSDDGGLSWNTDEEDGFLERLSWATGFDTKNEPLLALLQRWSNDRECLPVVFVRQMLIEALSKR